MRKKIAIGILIITAGFLFYRHGSERAGDNDAGTRNILPDEAGESTGEVVAQDNDFEALPPEAFMDVPFTAQAPFGNWDDVRQDYGCEEAALIMAAYWIEGKKLTPEIALKEIIAMVDFEQEKYGHFHDTSTEDTLKLFKDYYGYKNAEIRRDVSVGSIKKEIASNKLVIVPVDGTKLKNKFYTSPGPFVHKIVIFGYDDRFGEFITHDPGTIRGDSYKYSYENLIESVRDYNTGLAEPIDSVKAAMIVIGKNGS